MENLIIFLAAFVTVIAFLIDVIKTGLPYLKKKFSSPEKKIKNFNIENKEVNLKYPETIGLSKKYEDEGYRVRWASPRNVEDYKLKGYEILYEIDIAQQTKYSLIIKDSRGQVELIFMGKKQ